MTNPPEHPGGPPQQPDGPWGPPPPGQQPPQGPPPGAPQGPPPGPPQGPPPGWQPPGPPPGWQQPPQQPVWQGHQAPQQNYGWQPPQPPQKKRRTGLIVGVVVALLLLVGGGVAAAALLIAADDSDALAVSALEKGMCLSSKDLAAGRTEVDDLTETDCDGEHDAQVFVVLDVEDGEKFEDAGSRCAEALDETTFEALSKDGIEVRPLAASDQSDEIDSVVCFLRHEDGSPLTEELV